jgi:hypothetical protein
MAQFHPAWLERRRRYYTRPDGHRWIRPNGKLYLKPKPYKRKDALDQQDDSAEIEELLRLRSELAAIRAEFKFRWLRESKAGFNPNQPRVSAGSSDGGQWTSGGSMGLGGGQRTRVTDVGGRNDSRVISDATPYGIKPNARYAANESQRVGQDRADGHHYVPHALYDKLPIPDETRKVFDEAKTGRLYDSRSNKYDATHRIYNDAVTEHFKRFTNENNIQLERMTPEQARSFVDEVTRSQDPRVRNFNMRIQFREIMYRVFRGIRGNEQ